MKWIPAFLWLFFIGHDVAAQNNNFIKGVIVNGETGLPIPNASIFISASSKGTVSNAAGAFEILNVPVGNYDLVTSCIGYETNLYAYTALQLPLRLKIQLSPKPDELPNVVVEPYEKNGWETWGKFFTENFIGTSANARLCSIKNDKALHFRFSKKKNQLTVTADEPLIIENKALGYNIKFQLEGFSYGFSDRILVFYYYTLFEEMNARGPKEWQIKNRIKAYNGSIKNFMEALYSNSLAAKGFEVRRLIKRPNEERKRVQELYKNGMGVQLSKDSATYYEHILRQPEMLEEYGKFLLSADSLVRTNPEGTKRLFFPDYLYISYKLEKEEPEYLVHINESRYPFYQRSVVTLLNNHAITIDKDGNYFMPQDFFNYGYWSWSEKIASMLPLDFALPSPVH